MQIKKIKYKDGYKYQLAKTYVVQTSIFPPEDIRNQFCSLRKDGVLVLKSGYAWDGPSGPTFDTKTALRASLIHDALYQFMREGLLSIAWRPIADDELCRIGIEDGMWEWRAKLWKWVVQRYAKKAAINKREILTAP